MVMDVYQMGKQKAFFGLIEFHFHLMSLTQLEFKKIWAKSINT